MNMNSRFSQGMNVQSSHYSDAKCPRYLKSKFYGGMRAQSGVEFMFVFAFMISILGLAVYVYTSEVEEADLLRDNLEAVRVCTLIASSISSFGALGGNSISMLALPDYINYKNYTAYVNANNRVVKIDFTGTQIGVACPLQTKAIMNSSGASFFVLNKTSSLRTNASNAGIVVVGG